MKKRHSVIFIANYLPDKQESMSRACILYEKIIKEEGVGTKIIRPINRAGKLSNVFPSFKKFFGYIDKYIIFPIELIVDNFVIENGEKNVVYHITDHSNAIYNFCLLNRPRVVTCHDTLAINSMLGKYKENRTAFSGKLLQICILLGLKKSSRIVCVSNNTKNELQNLITERNNRITTTFQPLNNEFFKMESDIALKEIRKIPSISNKVLGKEFILHVGGNQWYKNRKKVCEIYAELDQLRTSLGQSKIILILAGKAPTSELIRFSEKNNHLSIIFAESPNDRQIRALYSLAKVLLFPSIHEGFGWPIVEAMACGCPVVTTGREPMTEAGGDAAIYIDPSDVRAAAETTNKVMEWSKTERETQAKIGYKNIKRFNRKTFAVEYKIAYEDALMAM